MPDTSTANDVFLGEFTDQRGVTRHLRAQIDRLASVDIHLAGINSWLAYVCEHSTKLAFAMARVQSANAQVMRQVDRLQKTAN